MQHIHIDLIKIINISALPLILEREATGDHMDALMEDGGGDEGRVDATPQFPMAEFERIRFFY